MGPVHVSPSTIQHEPWSGEIMLLCLAIDQNLDFITSQASAWADEELARRKLEMGDTRKATTLGYLDNPKNTSEEKEIGAGKERGAKASQAFDDAWANAKDKS
jgi:hypothetical protein